MYEIAHLLGAGGMGAVLSRAHTRLGRDVAIGLPDAAMVVVLNWSEELKQRVTAR